MNAEMKKKKRLSGIYQKVNINRNEQIIAIVLLLLSIFFLSLGMIQGTLGAFSRSFFISDSAKVSSFDVVITSSGKFNFEKDKINFEYHFISSADIIRLDFQIYNNGEVDIVCTPYINDDIEHKFYVAGIEQSEFTVNTKETVSFSLLIHPSGLDTNKKNVEFFVDVKQFDGGG